ncbi:MFS transporter [Paenibacillus anaericanus]|uniref:MFS transporter n=1 Tax=Paenibacillus anaericanus TaxID=170367 RepID=A0A3S1DYX0_9BACL|nr:MFS transporter [Paenibacillus anaericanus]RUT48198.1 MFS transporter [Paenibacillus anaericanus]
MDIFRNRNFSLMFIGRILTNIGDSLYAVAAMWLVYDLSSSTLYTGLAGFLSIIPKIIQLLSGPIIDRISIRGVLVYSQLIQGIILLIVPIASYFGFLSVGLVLIITPILTTCNTWVYPVQMSALPKILEKRQLTQGNSLFSVAYQGIDVACNAVSGILIGILGAVSIYLWNSIGFFIGAIIFSQLRIKPTARIHSETNSSVKTTTHMNRYFSDLMDGIRLLVRTPLSKLLFGVIIINAAGGATFSVLPMYSDYLGGAGIYGILLMAQALGSLVGALCAPFLKLERIRLGRLYSLAYILSGIAWCLSIYSPWLWVTILVYGLAWFPGGAVNVIINTVVQKGVPQQYLGLIFSATMALSGIALPLGSLIGGTLGIWLNSATVISLCGAAVLLVGLYWSFDKVSRNLPATEHIDEGFFNFSRKSDKSDITGIQA